MVEAFDIATAAADWAAPGRQVECPVELTVRRQQLYVHVNGWTFSAVWETGTYCTGARARGIGGPPEPSSPDAEIAVWKGDGPMIDLHGDQVEGWVSPASLLRAIQAAERDDEDGIRVAPVRQEAD